MHDSSSGVSETIGFILILGLVITGIALVTLFGYPMLLSEQANANVRNMEKGMIVLQNDIKSLAYQSVPFKETTLQVSGGSLNLNKPNPSNPSSSSFTINYGSQIGPFYPGDLEYLSDNNNQVVLLENGAVIVRQWDMNGSSMLAEPRWFYDDSNSTLRTFVIPLIRLDADSDLSRTGISTVQMKIEEINSTEIKNNGGTVLVTYHADPENDHRDAWKNYFMNSLQMTPTGVVGQYQKTGVDRLVVKTYNITVLTL